MKKTAIGAVLSVFLVAAAFSQRMRYEPGTGPAKGAGRDVLEKQKVFDAPQRGGFPPRLGSKVRVSVHRNSGGYAASQASRAPTLVTRFQGWKDKRTVRGPANGPLSQRPPALRAERPLVAGRSAWPMPGPKRLFNISIF